jgi:hypothetical protein
MDRNFAAAQTPMFVMSCLEFMSGQSGRSSIGVAFPANKMVGKSSPAVRVDDPVARIAFTPGNE